MGFREDGSYQSSNIPVKDNRYSVKDYGLYRGVVRDVLYTDHEDNESGGDVHNEVLYEIMIIGGERDGQVFQNARLIRNLGGWDNTEEVILKKLEGLTKSDPTSIVAVADLPIKEIAKFNRDVVYIQFLNGETNLPVIIGMGYHQAAKPEAAKADGQRFKRKFNGITTEITKDGMFNWTKSNGASLPVFANVSNPLYPYVSQFAPLPGQEEAVKFTLDNQYKMLLKFFLGLNLSIDAGVADTVTLATTLGTMWKLTGSTTDSFEMVSKLGTSLKMTGGTTDSFAFLSKLGTTLTVTGGTSDEIAFKTKIGDSFSFSGKSGLLVTTPTKTSLSMKNGAVEILSAAANFKLDATGLIKIGNKTGGDAFALLGEFIMSMSTATYSGFGAPGSNVGDLAQYVVKWKMFTG